MFNMRVAWAPVVGLFAALGPVGSAPAQTFQGLDDLPGIVFRSEATGVSADGSVVVGVGSSGDPVLFSTRLEAFRWTAVGGMVALGDLPGGKFSSRANGVSADGSVVVGNSISGPGREAFRWTATEGMVGLGDLPGGGVGGIFFRSDAFGVSADGLVVVGFGTSDLGREAFRWTDGGGMVALGDLPKGFGSLQSIAHGVSGDGSVVVGCGRCFGDDHEGFRWTADGGMVGLGNLELPEGSFKITPTAVSADGLVVVGDTRQSNTREAFRWTANGGMVPLGGAQDSRVLAVSADGSVAVGSTACFEGSCGGSAFVWGPTNGACLRFLQDVLVNDFGLDLTGWILDEATGVSADALTIVGTGRNPNGDTEAWIATLPPGFHQASMNQPPVISSGPLPSSFDPPPVVSGDTTTLTLPSQNAIVVSIGSEGRSLLLTATNDASAPLFRWSIDNPPATGTVSIEQITTSGDQVGIQYLSTPQQTVSDSFTIRVDDQCGGTATHAVKVIIDNAACGCGSGMDGMMVMPMTLLGMGWMRRRRRRRKTRSVIQ